VGHTTHVRNYVNASNTVNDNNVYKSITQASVLAPSFNQNNISMQALRQCWHYSRLRQCWHAPSML